MVTVRELEDILEEKREADGRVPEAAILALREAEYAIKKAHALTRKALYFSSVLDGWHYRVERQLDVLYDLTSDAANLAATADLAYSQEKWARKEEQDG